MMNINRRRSGGIAKKRRSIASLNRSRVSRQPSFAPSTSGPVSDQQDDHCIKVVVRARPLNSKEVGKGCEILNVVDENLLLFDPPQEEEDFFFQGKKQHLRDLNKRVNKNVRFLFDRVFDGNSSNEQVFAEAVRPIIDNLLSGFNCSVFAYGATGAGKTFTMLGAASHPGIIYLIVQDLFHRIGEMENKTCELNISYLEVYNETVKDLLRPSPSLQIRDDSKNVVIAGLSFQKPTSAEHLLNLLRFGNQNRTQHPTDANAESSRSHAVFQIYLKVKDRVGGLSEKIQLSKISLIDLAGSERASVVSNRGKARLREGANINQSLLALGTCINALTSKNGKAQHVPYRNSKLTRILKDSLGGNCKTVMIAAVSPSAMTYEDTYNTLKYAERAKEIKVSLKRNTTHVDAHLSDYKNIVCSLQKEVESLKRQLEDATTQAAKRQKISSSESSVQTLSFHELVETLKRQLQDTCTVAETPKRPKITTSDFSVQTMPVQESQVAQNPVVQISSHTLDPDWKDSVDSLVIQLKKYKKNVLDCESTLLSTQVRQFWRQFAHDRLAALTSDQSKVTRSHSKLDTFRKTNNVKAERLTNEKMKNIEKYQGAMEALNCLEGAPESTELEKVYIQCCKKELENLALHNHLNHVLELSTSNFKQTHDAWKICEQALQHSRMQQSTLKGHGFLTSQLTSQFDDLLKQAECGREVAWVDNPPVPNALHQELLQHLLLPSSGFQTAFPITIQADPQPLMTYADSAVEEQGLREPSSVFAVPSTPCRLSPPATQLNFMSPPASKRIVHPEVSKQCPKRGSPHPNKQLSKMNRKELLALINHDEQDVRRSLEETFTTQDNPNLKSGPDWQISTVKPDLGSVNFSPVGYAHSLSSGHVLYVSTPCSERPQTLGAESCMAQFQVPDAAVNTFFLSEADHHSCHHLEQIVRASPHPCDLACQQAHHKTQNVYYVPQCSGSLPDTGSPAMTVQQGAAFSMLPPCPTTVTRPGRLAPSHWGQGRVVSVLPSPRNPPAVTATQKNQVGLVSGRHLAQGTADRRHLVSSNAPSRVPPINTGKYIQPKENVDPQKSEQKPAKKIISGIQRRSATPANKFRRNPHFKAAK